MILRYVSCRELKSYERKEAIDLGNSQSYIWIKKWVFLVQKSENFYVRKL